VSLHRNRARDYIFSRPTVAACPIQIDDVRLPLGYWAWEKSMVRTALTLATRSRQFR